MIKRFPVLTVLVAILVVCINACVDVPDNGIVPPDYAAKARVIYADPALATSTLGIAAGPSFTSFSDLPPGAYGTATDYLSYPAGAKKIYVKKADGSLADADTSTITLGTETVTALIVMPRRLAGEVRIRQVGERSTFAAPGVSDSTRIRFANCVASKDTVDVFRIRPGSTANVSDNLRYDRTSAFFSVPRDSAWRFYVTRYNSTAGRGDTVSIVGASHKQFTVVLYDSLSRIKVLTLEDK